ncbi:four helix bundle protein [Candidatus Woesearchaeota archaeon]|nr:four helix bundle protein [Candidatus Woesearchaeota archaeon]
MVTKRNYNSLEIYHLAHQFVLDTYDLIKDFPEYESNNLASQFRRAATCLPLNIAEGSGANSNKIFLNFLIFCYRSCLETQACLKLSLDLKYISTEKYREHFEKLDKFVRKLYRYMEYLEKSIGNRKYDKSYYYRQQKYYADSDVKKRESMRKLC